MLRTYIKRKILNIYHRIFPIHEIFSTRKKIVSYIIKKYQAVDYEQQVAVETSMGEHTKGLLSLFLESKTFNFIFLTYLKNFVYPGIQETIDHTETIQKKLLSYLLTKTKDTVFGKTHAFALFSHQEYDDFVKHVPLVNYDQYQGRIERAKKEANIIWPGKIVKFSASAGTTSRKKHIPVTNESLESVNKAGLDMFATYAAKHPETQAFGAYVRPVGGTIQEQLDDESIIGDISALLILERNRILQKKYKYPLEVLLEPNRYTKRELFANQLVSDEHTMMLGVTSRISEMLKYMKQKDPKKFLSFIQKLDMIVRGGVSAKPYIKHFNELKVPHIGVYNASEGYFGYQDIVHYDNTEAQAPYQLLINHGIFYECIPFTSENFDQGMLKPNAVAKPLWEIGPEAISQKTNFALVITTNSGLFRYMIGDVIRFVDKDRRFEIIGRTKECINLKGEELMEHHINIALQKINQIYASDFSSYTIGPDREDEPQRHEWILEGVLPKACSKEQLTTKIDALLQQENADYEAKRKNDILLKMPIIHIVAPGTFHQRMRFQKKMLGGQTKITKLSSERENIEEILGMLK